MSESVIERFRDQGHWVLHAKNPTYDAVLDDEEMGRLGRAWLREKIGDQGGLRRMLEAWPDPEPLTPMQRLARDALLLQTARAVLDTLDGGQG